MSMFTVILVLYTLQVNKLQALIYPPSSTSLGLIHSVSYPVVEYLPDRSILIDWCFQMSYTLPGNVSQFYNIPIWPGIQNPKPGKRSAYDGNESPELQQYLKWLEKYDRKIGENQHPMDLTAGELYRGIEDYLTRYVSYTLYFNKEPHIHIMTTSCLLELTICNSFSNNEQINAFALWIVKVVPQKLYGFISGFQRPFGLHDTCLLRSVCELAQHPFDDKHQTILTELFTFVLTPSLHQGFSKHERTYQEAYEAAELHGFLGENCTALYVDCKRDLLSVVTKVILISG
ncbi:uncharacterized protein [Eurosta solidaginis]|uniref:uncharacterized protein isoform X1 n=1 Tax=Eurosta solidaginis TaxID=178769 RepID=UPI0035313AF2